MQQNKAMAKQFISMVEMKHSEITENGDDGANDLASMSELFVYNQLSSKDGSNVEAKVDSLYAPEKDFSYNFDLLTSTGATGERHDSDVDMQTGSDDDGSITNDTNTSERRKNLEMISLDDLKVLLTREPRYADVAPSATHKLFTSSSE